MDDKIALRLKQISDLQGEIKDIDKDITLILQCLQWDRKDLLESKKMVTCKYNCYHRIPADARKEHEDKCYLKSQCYDPKELFLPEPLDISADTVVKFSAANFNDIISYAMKTDPLFKKSSNPDIQRDFPLTFSRLQSTFTADERRALYDATVAAAPVTHRLEDLTPAGTGISGVSHAGRGGRGAGEARLQQLAALRDARRRRARHRRAAHSYRDELRAVIDTQMDLLFEQQNKDRMETDTEFLDRNNDIEHRRRSCEGDGDQRRDRRGSNVNYYKSIRKENRDGHKEKRKFNDDREYRDRDGGERRESSTYDEYDKRQRNYAYVKIKQEKDVEIDSRSRDNRAKRTHQHDREYRDRGARTERAKGNYDYYDKRRYYEKDCVKIKREKDVEYEGSSRERDDYRHRGRGRHRDEERSHKRCRHQDDARYERGGDKCHSRVKRERDNELVNVKEEPAWGGY